MSPNPRFLSMVVSFTLCAPPFLSLTAAEFIRGDVNGDGRVTISDAYRLSMWLSGGPAPSCMDAADVNDDGQVDASDGTTLIQALFSAGYYMETDAYWDGPSGIPQPFPAAGPDPTDDALDCAGNGTGDVIEDLASELKSMPFPPSECDESCDPHDNQYTIALGVKTSLEIAGFSGRVRFLDPIVQGFFVPSTTRALGFMASSPSGEFGAVLKAPSAFPDDSRILISFACLKEGTPAGDYPFVIESAEMTDAETGSAIVPAAAGGTIVVREAVTTVSPACSRHFEDPSPYRPESVDAVFGLDSVRASPGCSGMVTFTVRANAPIEGYSFSIDFDEEVLQVESAEFAWQRPDGGPYAFSRLEFNNRNDQPGNAGVDEGTITGAALFETRYPVVMPPDTDNPAVRIRFRVNPEATPDASSIRFLDGSVPEGGQPVNNVVSTWGFSVDPDTANSFVFLNGIITVVPDIATFRRGDANADLRVDLSDPVLTLGFLFMGGEPPACLDAADFNDDGRLDVADPIATLGFLYLGGKAPPPPFPDVGRDPTEDSMGCLDRN